MPWKLYMASVPVCPDSMNCTYSQEWVKVETTQHWEEFFYLSKPSQSRTNEFRGGAFRWAKSSAVRSIVLCWQPCWVCQRGDKRIYGILPSTQLRRLGNASTDNDIGYMKAPLSFTQLIKGCLLQRRLPRTMSGILERHGTGREIFSVPV